MANIVINNCLRTSNKVALLAVLAHIDSPKNSEHYKHDNDVYLKEGVYRVKETPMCLESPSTSCEFEVSFVCDYSPPVGRCFLFL